VFKVTPGGKETVLWYFMGSPDGAYPFAGLVEDSDGNFYGTTVLGGASGGGMVFKVTPGGAESVPHSFKGGSDGANPYAGLLADATGNFYGTTQSGGGTECRASGCGTVFELTPDGGSYSYKLLYSFKGGSDGAETYAGLIADSKGNLYGTTLEGGASHYGAVFELTGTGFAAPQACKSTDATLTSIKFPKSGELTYDLSSPSRIMALISLTRETNIGSFTLPARQKGEHSATGGRLNKAKSSQLASFELQVSFTDPRFSCLIESTTATLRITTGSMVTQSLAGIPKSEHLVEVADGTPGLSQLKISVNGKLFKTLSLLPGGTAQADLSAAMTLDENTLTFSGEGKLGSFANILVSDSVLSK
jgi:uncharacterized repeat protein (TIGR03803 family)